MKTKTETFDKFLTNEHPDLVREAEICAGEGVEEENYLSDEQLKNINYLKGLNDSQEYKLAIEESLDKYSEMIKSYGDTGYFAFKGVVGDDNVKSYLLSAGIKQAEVDSLFADFKKVSTE